MNASELLLRFVAGGALIVIITLLSKTKYPFLAGVMVLFPAVTLVGYYFLGQSVNAMQLKTIALYSMYALPATFVFLLAFYFLQGKVALIHSLVFSVIAWSLAAGILVWVSQMGGK